MKWTRGYRSDQVDDRRDEVASAGLGGGGISLLFFLFRRFGIAGLLIGGAALFFLSRGGSPSALTGERGAAGADQAEQPLVEFVSYVFDDAQSAWKQKFASRSGSYRLARLTLFRDQIGSSCGMGQAAMGPFYCPEDERVYIDLSFYDELRQRFGASGDFAHAYVIAHEVGHHVQHILGADRRVHQATEGERSGATGLSVKLELQADCYAGIWAHTTEQRQLLEAGDVDEALKAASVIGDDALQRKAGKGVRPESFTHGTSQQRMRWFKRGYETGEIAACDTFAAGTL
jgi:predicted metalloprotease